MNHAHDLTLYLAAGTILAAPPMAWAMDRFRGWIFLGPEPLIAASVALRLGLVPLSLGAGAIHFAVTNDHFSEGLLAGLLMAAVGWFQLLWPMCVTGSRGGLLDLAAIAVNAGTVIAWLASRTIGVPTPIGDGGVEPVGALDVLATSFEVAIVLSLTALLLRSGRRGTRSVSTRSASLAVGAIGLIVVVLTTASIGSQLLHQH